MRIVLKNKGVTVGFHPITPTVSRTNQIRKANQLINGHVRGAVSKQYLKDVAIISVSEVFEHFFRGMHQSGADFAVYMLCGINWEDLLLNCPHV